MDKVIDLDFIPNDLEGSPMLGQTLAKDISVLLSNYSSDTFVLEKYVLANELYSTGKATFKNVDTPEGLALLEYFKTFCETYRGYSNQIKGQILLKFL